MQVFHPHGLLPQDFSSAATKIVFTARDFDEVVGRNDDAWNQSMRSILIGTLPLFIGLSGDDQRLRSLLDTVKVGHPAITHGGLYWGIRPTVRSEEPHTVDRWRELGIAPRYIPTYGDLPSFLLGICQRAAQHSLAFRA